MHIKNAEILTKAAKSCDRVDGLTHNFYKYPARFSPMFVKSVIEIFSKPGDLVLDPFVGGGTTLVEASILGRQSIGVDISSLASFISKVKTTPLLDSEISSIELWAEKINKIKLSKSEAIDDFWVEKGYIKNISDSSTWRLRDLINNILVEIDNLKTQNSRDFMRCVLLRTSQWALDGRDTSPSVDEFRKRIRNNINEMICAIKNYNDLTKDFFALFNDTYVQLLNRSAIGIESESLFQSKKPRLILMSPPYPGIHVLYHRWQVKSRKETAAPFWIANKLDGNGESYYTFGNRQTHCKSTYFDDMQKVFFSLAKISDSNTIIVQMLAFSDPKDQLNRYLRLLNDAGFDEIFLNPFFSKKRIWRDIPNRKWYTELQNKRNNCKEVVLIHKKR